MAPRSQHAHAGVPGELRHHPGRDAGRTAQSEAVTPTEIPSSMAPQEIFMRLHLRVLFVMAALSALLCLASTVVDAQPPGGGKKGDKGGGKGSNETVDEFVNRLMAFNKAKDGKLTKTELFDSRLH